MVYPGVSIIWLNYNSMGVIDRVLASLQSVFDLDYPPNRYELIIVDNGSSDGSFEAVKKFVEGKDTSRVKMVRLERNLGFTGGVNLGFSMRNRGFNYVALLNNDAVATSNSLRELVEFAESYRSVAAVQGVVLDSRGRVDTAGGFMTEDFEMMPYLWKEPAGKAPSKAFAVTYADGSYALYRIEYIERCVGGHMFIWEMFAYGDDNILGLMLWNCGYASVSIPVVVAEHERGSTFRSLAAFRLYLAYRNNTALSMITNSRYSGLIQLNTVLGAFKGAVIGRHSTRYIPVAVRSLVDGRILGRRLAGKGIHIDIYRAPVITVKPLEEVLGLYMPGRLIRKKITERVSRFIERFSMEDFEKCWREKCRDLRGMLTI
ncbi:glycosyltransferase family 2 protein [Desulfurococcus mucosus]|uniref:Glycosyl transferase family 2 n=1 Tax=Desulfurococcus mucosus (strain ATCC 35584 / DSM 2162 / JCM 9187 / O7/1) TaxID=765177 RepID=E8RAL1_DESM0|nr:glycosyltransferase family 2 protein [Desulfurococcus mucosus]ADV65447.1 glycosyl transferase family 2 [Desulfurococcus mucosus DSM 2162]